MFDEEPSSKLSRKMNMSIQAREAPSQLVSTSGSQRGSIGMSQMFSPMVDLTRPLNLLSTEGNKLGMSPKTKQSVTNLS